MSDDNNHEESGIRAEDTSIAVGSVTVSGSVRDLHIGHTIGFTSEDVSILLTKIKSEFEPKPFDGRCPYKGLDVFEERDADLFFGREQLVRDLVGRVRGSRAVFITGPSGSGKSSLVRAGLIHAVKLGVIKDLQSDCWQYAPMRPGRNPGEALAAALSRLKSPELGNYFRQHMTQPNVLNECIESVLSENKNERLVLFIDQFEEIFTQISKEKEEERTNFLNLLTNAASIENGRTIILFSMRSDFLPYCAAYPELNALLNQQFIQIGAMRPEELVSAIAQPALHVGLRIDPDLIAQIINDMEGEPGALPLMQFALKDLFDSEQEKGDLTILTLNEYFERGGIHKALERHANKAFDQLNAEEQDLARMIFSGLIEIGRGREDTSRIALFSELVPADAMATEVHSVVQRLADARLITTDEQAGKHIVSLSHEKLIDAWGWLRRLVDDNRDAIALQNEITGDAEEWFAHKKDASYLYTGVRLAQARQETNAGKLTLSERAQTFVREGYARERRDWAARVAAISAIIVLVIAGITIYFYLSTANSRNLITQSELFANTQAALASTAQANANAAQNAEGTAIANQVRADQSAEEARKNAEEAQRNADEANKQALYAVSDSLSSLGLSRIDTDYTESLLFGTESFRLLERNDLVPDNYFPFTLGELLQTTPSGLAESLVAPPSGTVWKVAYSVDGEFMVAASNTVDLWDTTNPLSPTIVRSWTGPQGSRASDVAFSPDGTKLAVGFSNGTAELWDLKNTNRVAEFSDFGSGILTDVKVAFNPSGKILAISGNKQISLWSLENLDSPEKLYLFKHPHEYQNIVNLFFLPAYEGNLVSMGEDNALRIWDLANPREPTLLKGINADEGIISMAISNERLYGIVLASNSELYFYDYQLNHLGSFYYKQDQPEPIRTMAFNPTRQQLFTASGDGTIAVWDVSNPPKVSLIRKYSGHTNIVNSIAFHPGGQVVASGGLDSKIAIWNVEEGASPSIWNSHIQADETITDIAYSPMHSYLAVGYADGNIQMWKVSSTAPVSFIRSVSLNQYHEVLDLDFDADENTLVIRGGRNAGFLSSVITRNILDMDHSMPQFLIGLESADFYAYSRNHVLAGLDDGDNLISIYSWRMRYPYPPRKSTKAGTTVCPSTDTSSSRNGSLVVIASCTVQFWSFSGNKVPTLVHEEIVLNPQSVAFSRDGSLLVSGNGDQSVNIWDVSTTADASNELSISLTPVGRINSAHQRLVTAVALSPDKNLLATGGDDQNVVLWDITNPQNPIKLLILRGQTDKILNGALFFTGDGKTLISASQSEVILWDIDPKSWREKACKIAGRNLTQGEWDLYVSVEEYPVLQEDATCPQWPLGH